jgi:predicted nucleic acid-binding protein
MILLDTNVVSESTKPQPNDRVLAWLNALDPAHAWICAVTVAEIRLGVASVPSGRRKAGLMELADRSIEKFGKSCLPFDAVAAELYPAIMLDRRRLGRPIEVEDAQIAAIAIAAGFTLATLSAKDFEGITGLTVVDPSAQ